jgi:pimeloyl-ACP methyl ester carboxylesterase
MQQEENDQFINLNNGTIIHYMEQQINVANNRNEKITLLLLHGSFQTCHTWDDFIQCLQRQEASLTVAIHVIAMDLRGHGDSSHTDLYRLDDFAQDVSLFIEQKNLQNVILMGMSLGGLVALQTCILYPSDRIDKKCVIVDITPNEIYQGAKEIRKSVNETLPVKPFEEWVQWACSLNPKRPIDNLKKRLQYSLKRLGDTDMYTWKYDQKFKLDSTQKDSEEMWDNLHILKQRKMQFLLVIGGASQVTSKEGQQRFIEITGARMALIENAGHSVQGDEPMQFTNRVLEFIL